VTERPVRPGVNRLDLATRAIHAGQKPEPATGAVITPIFTAATYVQESPGVLKDDYVYSRTKNPTRLALEQCIADLESGTKGFAFASGMAAISTVVELVDSGAHIVATDDLYGGVTRLFETVRKRSAGINVSYVDITDRAALEAAIRPETRMIWVESPTNPLLRIVDLAMVAEVARSRGILAVCDNTFATPMLQRPLELGFDIVIHSATKYLGGHSDVILGIAVVAGDELAEKILRMQIAIGGIAGPFDCYLVLRGIKTLAVRIDRHCENAAAVAEFLAAHPRIETVYYPGLANHPGHETAMAQMGGRGGGMVTANLKGNLSDSKAFLERCELFQLAESLGGVESLIEHPAIMTHASVPAERRQRLGIADGLIRISVGIENIEDLCRDLSLALA
jgi:cystathionine gamma-lyase